MLLSVEPNLSYQSIVIVEPWNSLWPWSKAALKLKPFRVIVTLLQYTFPAFKTPSIQLLWRWIESFPSGQYPVYCPMKLGLMKSTAVLSFSHLRGSYQCGVSSGVAGLHMTFGFLEPRFTIACCHCSLDRHQSGSHNTEDGMCDDGIALRFLFLPVWGSFFGPLGERLRQCFQAVAQRWVGETKLFEPEQLTSLYFLELSYN